MLKFKEPSSPVDEISRFSSGFRGFGIQSSPVMSPTDFVFSFLFPILFPAFFFLTVAPITSRLTSLRSQTEGGGGGHHPKMYLQIF